MDELEVKIRPGTYPNLDDIIVEGEQPTILLPCIICNKTFIPEALQRHSKVCEKNATKKRKTFDSFKQRVQGTELAEFLPLANLQKRNSGPEKPYSPKKTVSHWKEKHEAFVSAIRAARGCGEGSGSVGIVETRLSYRPPDHERCPYCERHFGPKAFDRHQEWCREQHARQPPSAASQLAKERLEARIKYRAPPIKSKRALTREKYSPLVQRKARQLSPGRNSNHSTSAGSTGNTKQDSHRQYDLWNRSSGSGNSLSGRSSVKDSYSGGGLNRGMPSRTSLRASQRSAQRSVSPLKRSTISTKSLSSSYSQPPIQDRKSQDGGGDSIPSSYNTKKNLTAGGMAKQAQQRVCESQLSPVQKQSSSANSKPRKMQTEEKENIRIINNKNKKSDQKWSGGQPEEPYDPYASAERQMMELLHSDSACDVRKAAHTQKSKLERSPASAHSISPVGSPTNSPKSLSLETSPTSAFTRYTKETEPPSPESQVIPQPQCQSQTQLQKQSMPQTPQPQLPLMQHTQTKHDDLYHSDSLLTQSQLLQTSQNEIAQSLTLLPLMQQPPERQPPPQSQSQTRETQAQQTRSETQLQPLPPPRSFKRSASLQATSESSNTGVSRTPLESFLSIDVELVENNNTCKDDLDNRPGTYDVERSSGLKYRKKDENGWLNSSGKSGSEDIDAPVLQETADGVRSEILLLDNKVFDYKRCGQETRESREIREITENSCGISGIDGLLEEVVRMQRSVSMLNAQEPNHETPVLQSSVRSRRSRAGKMHIEDYLFPAELLQQEDINLDDHSEHLGRSSLVFGSTKSRRTSSKGRRLIEDLLFPSLEVDINANSDVNEDSDVIVSANALMGVCTPPVGFNTSPRGSPVALTSKMINDDDDDDGLPRPKPLVSTRSSQQSTGAERVEPVSSPDSPIQLSTVPKHQIHQTRSRLSSDSAYNSLNRRSPIPPARRHVSSGGSRELSHRNAVGGESPQSVAQSVVLSSSSSESSLPPLSAASHIRHSGRGKNDRDTPCSEITSATTPFLPKLSKFCHECGTRFPMTAAKFCHECGVKRLEL